MQAKQPIDTVKKLELFNLGFSGGQREGKLTIDGQYIALCNENEFVLLKVGGYRTLTHFPEVLNPVPAILAENDYRYAHDIILERLTKSHEASENEIKTFKNTQLRYQLAKQRISKNITNGDTVTNLLNNETFTTNYNNDIVYINRDFNYKLTNREVHPEPEILENFIKVNESTNPFTGWTLLNEMPKLLKTNCVIDRYIINNETFIVTSDYTGNGRYIIQTPHGKIYDKSSPVSSPLYAALDILTGSIRSEYDSKSGKRYEHVYKNVVHEGERSYGFISNNYKLVTEPKSYNYNTRLTFLQ